MKKIREWYEKYDRKIGLASIFFGFLFDSLTLVRIDLVANHFLMLAYFVIAAVGIALINIKEEGRAKFLSDELYLWLFIAMQFSFGGLFGRFFLYYFHSGVISQSFLFLALLFGLLIGNEFSKKHYTRLALQISYFFLALLLFLIYFVPIIVGKMGDVVFVFSGVLALALMYGFYRILKRLSPARIGERTRLVFGNVIVLFVCMNLLYFTNSIPPLPLSLREAGVYHSVSRTTTGYKALVEADANKQWWRREQFSVKPGESLSVYSAVFAPTAFGAEIVHDWQQYDATTRTWVSMSRVPFPIYGGQDRGYRGYSIKSNIKAGLWRVRVQTARGQVLGFVRFEVRESSKTPPLQTIQL